MDCDTCGRYRPSPEIRPLREAGRLSMVCARCLRLATSRRHILGSGRLDGTVAVSGPAVLAPSR